MPVKNKCFTPIAFDAKVNPSWANAITEQLDIYEKKAEFSLEPLIETSADFYFQLTEFLEHILKNSSQHKNKMCQLNISEIGFHFCSCFAQNRPEEVTKEFVFVLTYRNQDVGYFEYSRTGIARRIKSLKNDYEPWQPLNHK